MSNDCWHVAHVNSLRFTPFEAVERVRDEMKWDAWLLTGWKIGNIRSALRDSNVTPVPVKYAPLFQRVFVRIPETWTFNYAELSGRTGIYQFERRADYSFLTVPDSEIVDLQRREAAGEFDHWLHKAIKFFSSIVGSEIIIPNGQWGGTSAIITGIKNCRVLWQFDLLGVRITGASKIQHVYPNENIESMATALTLAHGGVAFPVAPPEDAPEPQAPLPSNVVPFSMGRDGSPVVKRKKANA